MKRWFAALLLAICALGLVLRAPMLDLRPLHNDEGVNAIKFRGLYVNNKYKYDPNEFHGPTLPYLTLPFAWAAGARDFDDLPPALFRAVPVVFGVGLILLLCPLVEDLGSKQTLWAALFTAISPAMAYYSRDYIHETLLTFFTALAFASAWRFYRTRQMRWAIGAGMGFGLMASTKETFVFALAAMGVAIVCETRKVALPGKTWIRGVAIIVLLALVIAVLFFTSFLTNRDGIVDAVRAYLPWLHRAGGAPSATEHGHPWYFYFQRLFFFREGGGWIWSEAVIGILALIGFFAAETPFARVVRIYTFVLTLIYCILPYKTPWCLLGFYHGMILLAGVGAVALLEYVRQPRQKAAVAALLALGCVQLCAQTCRANFVTHDGALLCADPSNPYVYAQTSTDIARLMETVNTLAKVAPQKYETPIEVISAESYWPLPWYLRRFKQAGYWDGIPDQALAPIMIVNSSFDARFDERPGKTHLMAGYYKLRPGVFFELYVNIGLWTHYVQSGAAAR